MTMLKCYYMQATVNESEGKVSFQNFLNEFAEDVRVGAVPYECSRIDMRVASEEGIIALLFRTRPRLSGEIFATSPYQYPLPLLLNTRLMLRTVTRHIQSGAIFPALSELSCMATLDALHEYGVSVAEGEGVISVPKVKENKNPSVEAARWAQVLMDDPHINPAFAWQLRGMDVFFVHLPDAAVDLSEDQLLHIAKLVQGWNYADYNGRKYMKRMAGFIREAARAAEIIVDYGS